MHVFLKPSACDSKPSQQFIRQLVSTTTSSLVLCFIGLGETWLPVEISLGLFAPLSACLSHFIAFYSWIRMLESIGIDTVSFFLLLLPFLPGFPNEPAAEIALNTVKSWIEENPDKVGHARRMHI